MSDFMIYGANGYTGELIVREAVAQRLRPIIAGRSQAPMEALARRFDLPYRVFELGNSTALGPHLQGIAAILNCAGPFARTAKPIVDACLRVKVHYLDITGEVEVFEALARRDLEAKAAGIMLLPGVGFDVVPSDCLAAHLKHRLPTATHLQLAFAGLSGRSGVSRGTARTIVENLHHGGLVRRGGVLTPVPSAWKTRWIDFGRGPTKAMTIPWGDVSTAYYSTGIPNIEVYMAAPLSMRLASRLSRRLGWLLGSAWVQRRLKKRIDAGPPGPSDEERARGQCVLWGRVSNDRGEQAVSRLRGPEGYTLTVFAALEIARRVLNGSAPPGFQTPSSAYGADLILSLPRIVRTDES